MGSHPSIFQNPNISALHCVKCSQNKEHRAGEKEKLSSSSYGADSPNSYATEQLVQNQPVNEEREFSFPK